MATCNSLYVVFALLWGLRIRYDWRSVSQYVLAWSPRWDFLPDINSVWILLSCLCWTPSLTRGRVCLLSVTVSNNCPPSSFIFCLLLSLFFSFLFTRQSAQAQYSRWCSIICSLHYNSNLNTWTVVLLTTIKFKPFKFSMYVCFCYNILCAGCVLTSSGVTLPGYQIYWGRIITVDVIINIRLGGRGFWVQFPEGTKDIIASRDSTLDLRPRKTPICWSPTVNSAGGVAYHSPTFNVETPTTVLIRAFATYGQSVSSCSRSQYTSSRELT
jgi:hypothetical protein